MSQSVRKAGRDDVGSSACFLVWPARHQVSQLGLPRDPMTFSLSC